MKSDDANPSGIGDRKLFTMILATVAVALSLAMVLVAVVKGGCAACLTTDSGACVPMTCHWTFRTVALLGIVAVVVSVGWVLVREARSRRFLAFVDILVAALVAIACYTPVMGLCARPEMSCHTTACIVASLCVGLVVVSVAMAVVAKDGSGKPKMEL